jgi:PAS domain S-box-containing protein
LPLSLVIGVLVSLVLFGVTRSQANARAIAERTANNLIESRRALSENEVRVRRLIDANIIGVVIADSSGHVIEANDAFLEIVGRTREDLESGEIVWTERSPPESANTESDALAETHLQRRRPAFEHEYERVDGTRVPVLIGSAYLGGADELAVAFILDLTERKQAEAAVREADQRAISEYERLLERLTGLAQAFGSARDLLSIYRALRGFAMASVPCDGVFISLYDEWREHCEAAYAWGDGEEIDVSVLEPIPVSGDGPSSRAVKTGQIVVTDDYMQTPEGHSMVIVGADDGLHPESSLVAPLSVMGRIVGTMEVQSYKSAAYTNEHVVSIRMAANLAAVAIENVQLLERESRARNQAEESNRMKDEFLATVSHELRTPLTAILGWSRMLMMGGFDEATIMDAIETIERNATSQARLIDDILEVSRVVTGKLQLEVEPVELKNVVTAAVSSVRPAAEAKGISLSVRQPDAEDVVSGDPNRLQQVVWNLLSNGVKFTPEGGSIEVDLHRLGSEVILTVRDTGYGISAGFLPYVFDRFRQADSSITRTHGGLGLGLAIVRHLVELHGGSVSAESPGEDMGATFTVRLPLLRASSQKSNSKETTSGETRLSQGNRSLRGLRVMVVDDEMDTADMVEAVLARYGAVVSKANSVDEAMVELTRFVPDVIVSDIGMPGRDGYELIRMIRAGETGRGKRIPAIALTAYVRENDRAMALGAGFQEHLPKPVDPRKLLATIASLAGA